MGARDAAAQPARHHHGSTPPRIDTTTDRAWYADKAVENGWSRKVLDHHITTNLRERIGPAPSNFPQQLAAADSDLAREIVKDPYVFDFLTLTERATEQTIEQALMDRLQDTLLELGTGFAFVGRQVRFDVDGDEFFVDLLLFHVEQLRYVVVELKIGKFRHDYAGQLGFYVTMVDDQLRRPDRHAPTVGILLCTSRNDQVVRYALRSTAAPMAVSTFTYDTLPPAEQAALPAAATLAAAISRQGSVKADAPVTGSDTHGGHPPIPIMINGHRYRLFAAVPVLTAKVCAHDGLKFVQRNCG